jgi:hypothetical protein
LEYIAASPAQLLPSQCCCPFHPSCRRAAYQVEEAQGVVVALVVVAAVAQLVAAAEAEAEAEAVKPCRSLPEVSSWWMFPSLANPPSLAL